MKLVTIILFVSERNVCRSPLGELLLTKALSNTSAAEITVSSAGLAPDKGEPMPEETQQLGYALGLEPSGHTARGLTLEQVTGATLVLTATRRQRSAVVQLHPRAVKYTFTIRQLGRLLTESATEPELAAIAGLPADERVSALLQFATKHRGQRFHQVSAGDNVVDPFGESMETHELAVRQLLPALNRVAQALGGRAIPWLDDRQLKPLRA